MSLSSERSGSSIPHPALYIQIRVELQLAYLRLTRVNTTRRSGLRSQTRAAVTTSNFRSLSTARKKSHSTPAPRLWPPREVLRPSPSGCFHRGAPPPPPLPPRSAAVPKSVPPQNSPRLSPQRCATLLAGSAPAWTRMPVQYKKKKETDFPALGIRWVAPLIKTWKQKVSDWSRLISHEVPAQWGPPWCSGTSVAQWLRPEPPPFASSPHPHRRGPAQDQRIPGSSPGSLCSLQGVKTPSPTLLPPSPFGRL